MRIEPARIPDVLVVQPETFEDNRGFFMETYRRDRYESSGISTRFVQDNLSVSVYGVVRGLHFQHPNGQAKLVQVLEGEVFDVAVDVRRGSPSFGHWVGIRLSGENRLQLFIPEGFAHGFCVTGEKAVFHYKCGDFHSPPAERGILWNDPDLGIAWPLNSPVLSTKDACNPRLRDLSPEFLPAY